MALSLLERQYALKQSRRSICLLRTPMETDSESPLRCPSCAQQMQSLELARRALGNLRVDLCFGCCLIWFDQGESAQLAPAAVIELFQQINTQRSANRTPVAHAMSCPRCTQGLVLTHDYCKSGPLQYFRCPDDSGRLTPFFQFLREKQFLRALTPAELTRVRVEIKQLQCSNCGAPIDLEHSTSCTYCGSPVSILDANAVKQAMQMWTEEDARTRIAAAEALARVHRVLDARPSRTRGAESLSSDIDAFTGIETGSDLVQLCIAALGDLIV